MFFPKLFSTSFKNQLPYTFTFFSSLICEYVNRCFFHRCRTRFKRSTAFVNYGHCTRVGRNSLCWSYTIRNVSECKWPQNWPTMTAANLRIICKYFTLYLSWNAGISSGLLSLAPGHTWLTRYTYEHGRTVNRRRRLGISRTRRRNTVVGVSALWGPTSFCLRNAPWPEQPDRTKAIVENVQVNVLVSWH